MAAHEDAQVRAELEHEFDCLDRVGELDGVLANLGLSRGGVPVLLENYPGAMRRFAAMTARLGIGAGKAPTARAGIDALFGARRRCLFCSERRQCEAWLRGGVRDGYRAFCPNAAVFDRMRKPS
jgi:hypothetical protein